MSRQKSRCILLLFSFNIKFNWFLCMNFLHAICKLLIYRWKPKKGEPLLIQRLDEEYWIKSMYIKYITFWMVIRPHFCDSWNIAKQKKNEKILQCLSIKSPLLYNGFFKEKIIIHLLLNKYKKHIFWMEFHPKTLNLLMVLGLIDVYQYHTPF
jgi:hypothetical protein